MTIIGGVVYKISTLFEFLIFLHEIFFFGSKILSSSCGKHPKFDFKCLIITVLAQAFSLRHRFLLKINTMCVLLCLVRDFFIISSSKPLISTMHTRFS